MQATVKRRLTKVALALVVAGYCAAPAVAANGNLKSGQWQIVSEQTGTIQGTVPWITRAADKTADTDKDHVTVTIDRGDRKIVTEGDKQFHVGDKVTVNWAIGDTEGDTDTDNTATKATVKWVSFSDQNGSDPKILVLVTVMKSGPLMRIVISVSKSRQPLPPVTLPWQPNCC